MDDGPTAVGSDFRVGTGSSAYDVCLVDKLAKLEAAVMAVLADEDTPIAIDCEGVNLSQDDGDLCLVQVHRHGDGTVYIIDVQTLGKSASPYLSMLLGSPNLKLFYDLRGDTRAMCRAFGFSYSDFRNLLDLQVWVWATPRDGSQNGGRFLCGMNKALSLLDESEVKALSPAQKLKTKVGAQFSNQDYSIWTKRPLSEDGISYAAADVLLLHNLHTYCNRGAAHLLPWVLHVSRQRQEAGSNLFLPPNCSAERDFDKPPSPRMHGRYGSVPGPHLVHPGALSPNWPRPGPGIMYSPNGPVPGYWAPVPWGPQAM